MLMKFKEATHAFMCERLLFLLKVSDTKNFHVFGTVLVNCLWSQRNTISSESQLIFDQKFIHYIKK